MKLNVLRLVCIAAVLFVAHAPAQTFNFSNIQNWVGSGSNETAFVVAWNSGQTPDTLVWGYRWSGTAPTVLGMMQAIAAADTRFSFTANPLYSTPTDYAVYSVFYDLTGLGGTPVVGLPGNLGGKENGHAPFPGDLYREGWTINGFWGEVIGQGNPYNGGSWNSTSPQGVGVDVISNNSWYGLSFSTDEKKFTIPNPPVPQVSSQVPAVPGPAAVCFLTLASLGLAARALRRNSPARSSS